MSDPIQYLTLFGALRHAALVPRASRIASPVLCDIQNNNSEERREHLSRSHFFLFPWQLRFDWLFHANGADNHCLSIWAWYTLTGPVNGTNFAFCWRFWKFGYRDEKDTFIFTPKQGTMRIGQSNLAGVLIWEIFWARLLRSQPQPRTW